MHTSYTAVLLNSGLECKIKCYLICISHMWLMPGSASGRKTSMMVELQRGHCTAPSTVLAVRPAMVKDKNGEGQTVVVLYPIYDGVHLMTEVMPG